MMGFICGGIFILIISFLTFLPSFNLALFGDDWLAFFRYAMHVAPKLPGEWINLRYFLTPYGAQDILMGLLKSLFGFHSSYYYQISFILRLFAAFSLYPLVFYLTKDKLATLFSILFFSITVIGLDATNWVFNMPSYITIGLFNFVLYFFIKSREENQFKQFFLAALFYYLAYIITPIRMHGSLPFLFLLDFFWIIQKKDFKIFKKAAIRLSIIFTIFLFIKFSGQSLGPSSEIPERLNQGFTISTQLLQNGRIDFIFHPFIMLGSMFLPDFVIQQMTGVSDINFSTLFFSILSLFFFLIICLLLANASKAISKKFFLKFLFFSLIWLLISWIFFPKNIQPFPNNTITPATSFILLNIGGFTIILLALLLKENWRREKLSTALFISLVWPILAFFAAWWFTPQVIFPTTYRYLIISAVGISIILAIIINLSEEFKHKLILTVALSLFLILHIISTNHYLKLMENFHSQEITDKIWSSLPYIPEVGKEPLVFYFEGDNSNYIILHNVITFGFPPHMQILYHLTEKDYAPVPMQNWAEVISAISDGQSFKAYGYPLEPMPVNNVYAFRLEGKDNLINITDLARQKLFEEQRK